MLKNPTNRPSSSQIIEGLDANNKKLADQHHAYVITDENGNFNLSFTLLDDNTSYTVFITA
jgi:hypothetical protein